MDKKYEPVEMEVIRFQTEDIITASGGECDWEGEWGGG
jgi:hypothetical protein